jgi:hypothetical protein
MSLQPNRNAALRSEPSQWKNGNSVFTVCISPSRRSRLQWASIW